jgi:hypothetical protein
MGGYYTNLDFNEIELEGMYWSNLVQEKGWLTYKHGNEPLGCKNARDFFEKMNVLQLLNKNSMKLVCQLVSYR